MVDSQYQWLDVATTFNLEHLKHYYYRSHSTISANGLIPVEPELNLDGKYDQTGL